MRLMFHVEHAAGGRVRVVDDSGAPALVLPAGSPVPAALALGLALALDDQALRDPATRAALAQLRRIATQHTHGARRAVGLPATPNHTTNNATF